MAQLRLALAQINPVVGRPRRQRRAGAARGPGDAADQRRAPGRLPRDGADRLPGGGPGAAPVVRATRPAQALDTLAARLATDGLGELLVVVGYLDGAPDAVPVLGTPKGAPQNAAAVLHRGRVVARYAKHHLPNYGVFDEYRYFVPGTLARRSSGCTASTSRSRSARTSGRRAARSPVAREAGAGLLLVINGSPYERNKDDVRLDLVRAARGRGRLRARPTSTWSAARTSWSSTATRSSWPPTASCWPGPRSSTTSCSSSTSTCRRPRAGADGRRAPTARPSRSSGWCSRPTPLPACEPVAGTGRASASSDEAEVYGALVLGLRDYVRKNGFRRSCSASPAASTRRSSPRSPATRSARTNVHGVSMPERLLVASTRETDAADLAERTGLELPDRADRADGRRLPGAALQLTGLAEENLQARVRGDDR